MLKLEKLPIEYHGQTYELVCNMEALELLEEEYGDMKTVMNDSIDHVSAALFRIMLNCARADRGEEPVDKRTISRAYSYAMLREMDIFGLFLRAMSPEAANRKAAENSPKAAEEPAKN